MALPPAEDLVYRGINTGSAESMAYRGWVITIPLVVLKVLNYTVSVTKSVFATVKRSVS